MPKSGWAYSFKCCGLVQIAGEQLHVFKVGHSTRSNPLHRVSEFHGANRLDKLLLMVYVPNARRAETHILRSLRGAPGVVHLKHLGREWWACRSVELFNFHLNAIFSGNNSTQVFPRADVAELPEERPRARRRSARIAAQK